MTEVKEFIESCRANLMLAIIIGCIILAVWIVSAIAKWKVFKKMNEKGWKSLIPFYSEYILFSRCWDVKHAKLAIIFIVLDLIFFTLSEIFGDFDSLACAILFVVFAFLELATVIYNTYLAVRLCFRQSKAFGHGVGYGFGLLFLPYIFNFILGFGSSEYVIELGAVKEEESKEA